MYTKNQMVFSNYKWVAKVDHDNPKIISGTDHSELNRSEGYEMLYFINSLAKTWNGNANVPLSSLQNLERIIINKVPSNIRTHAGIKNWIELNYPSI
ncbi:MAG: hypothetical protein KGI58_03120 [Patescibacteria group bacterium]|nr:hypothetical protein [Patescibacteria group bacterium]